jgi:hypothetical protein
MDEVLKLKASCERCGGIDDVDLGYKRGEYKRCKTVRAESRRSEDRLFVEREIHEALGAFLRIEKTSACRYKSLEQKKAVETVLTEPETGEESRMRKVRHLEARRNHGACEW